MKTEDEEEDENEEDNLSDNDDDEDEDDEKPMKAPKKRKAPTKKPSTRLVDVPVPGPGPWWVFMMVNGDADEDTKKQTEIRTHTYPELTQAIKNRRDHGSWIIVQKMGPFYRYFDAGKMPSFLFGFTNRLSYRKGLRSVVKFHPWPWSQSGSRNLCLGALRAIAWSRHVGH